jgi:saccharopine dehydrogenase-like NADP-dependent oxidoreductase
VQAVVWQTALNPVIALELIATGQWKGAGVQTPEAFDAVPYLEMLEAYGAPHKLEERSPFSVNKSRIQPTIIVPPLIGASGDD